MPPIICFIPFTDSRPLNWFGAWVVLWPFLTVIPPPSDLLRVVITGAPYWLCDLSAGRCALGNPWECWVLCKVGLFMLTCVDPVVWRRSWFLRMLVMAPRWGSTLRLAKILAAEYFPADYVPAEPTWRLSYKWLAYADPGATAFCPYYSW